MRLRSAARVLPLSLLVTAALAPATLAQSSSGQRPGAPTPTFARYLTGLATLRPSRGLPALNLGRNRPSRVPDQYTLKLAAGVRTDDFARTALPAGARIVREVPKLGLVVVHAPPATVQALTSDPRVRRSQPRLLRYPLVADPNDPGYNLIDRSLGWDPTAATWYKWDAHMINCIPGWSRWPNVYFTTSGKNGKAVRIAVIDTGIDYGHPDFMNAGGTSTDAASGGQLLWDLDRTIFDGVVEEGAADEFGHGTHVAGIAAAATNNARGTTGVGYHSEVLSLKVVDAEGNGTDTDVAEAIVYAVDQGAQIINISLGSYEYSFAEQDAVNYAWRHGTLVVAAAGNDGNNLQPNYPGALSKVMAVSAVARTGVLAQYSNYGPMVCIAAPGGDWDFDLNWFLGVYSTTPTYYVTINDPDTYGAALNYDYLQGTSMASPQVAGAAALYAGQKGIAQNTFGGPSRIWQALQRAAVGGRTWSMYYGYGIVDIDRTLNLDAVPNPRSALSGGIVGQVLYKGTPVMNARIDAVNVATGRKVSAASRIDGAYRLIGALAGTYNVTASVFGEKTTWPAVVVTAGCDRPGIDFNVGAPKSNLTAPTVNTARGAVATLRARLTRASDNSPVEGAPVSIVLGETVLGIADTNSDGWASVAYTVPSGLALGAHTYRAVFDGNEDLQRSDASGAMNVQTPTKLWVGSFTASVGDPVRLQIYLRLLDNTPVVGQTVTWTIDGDPNVYSGVTGSNGSITYTYTVPEGMAPGKHAINLSFAGSAMYAASTYKNWITVTAKKATKIWFTNYTAAQGSVVNIRIHLLLVKDNSGIPGETVSWTIAGDPNVYTGVTGADGTVTHAYTVPPGMTVGPHRIDGTYAGSAVYEASTWYSTLTVTSP